MREIILIQVSGSDRPGLTAAFTRILARYRLNILDIGQAVIHDTLSLGILVETPPDANGYPARARTATSSPCWRARLLPSNSLT